MGDKALFHLPITSDLIELMQKTIDEDNHNSMVFFIKAILNDIEKAKLAKLAAEKENAELLKEPYCGFFHV